MNDQIHDQLNRQIIDQMNRQINAQMNCQNLKGVLRSADGR